jgi:uncharacterized protein YjbJ (UPF0337 family)
LSEHEKPNALTAHRKTVRVVYCTYGQLPPRGEEKTVGDQNSGPEEAVKGTVEGIKGKVKEVGGTLAGRDDIKQEGEAQQDKADAERDAAKKEAEADAARSGADAAEERQKKHQ